MPNMTLSFSDETMKKIRKHPEIRWSRAVKSIIERKLEDLEASERLALKSTLSEKEVEKLSEKSGKAAATHARKLLNESYG